MIKKVIFISLLILNSISLVWSDTNGIWIDASDIKGGVFGSDEGNPNYQFPNNLLVTNTLNSSSIVSNNVNTNFLNSSNVDSNYLKSDLIESIDIQTTNITTNRLDTNLLESTDIQTDKITSQEYCIGTNCRTDWSSIWQEGFGGDIYYNVGSVGIGKSNPFYALDIDVSGAGYSSSYYGIRSTGGNYGIYSSGSVGGGYFRDDNDYTYTRISYGDYGIHTNGDIRTTGDLCINNDCRGGFQAVKKPNINTGTFDWTTIYNDRFQNGPGNKLRSRTETLDNRPILGIRISGKSDDGGFCVVQIGEFAASVGWSARHTELGPNYGEWLGRAYDGNEGSFPTKTFMIDELNSGIWSYKSGTYSEDSETIRGYFASDLDHRNRQTWAYNKPLGMSYTKDNSARIVQWYNDGQGGYYNDCKVDILYGDFV